MDSNIVVTGASSGIGYETAQKLHQLGYMVIGVSRNKPKAPFDWLHMTCDLSDPSAIDQLFHEINADFDSIDALINCAGYGIGGAIELTDYDAALQQHKVNVLGPFYLIKTLMPLLRLSSNPKIINIGSVAGDITIPFQAFYSMSKASLASMTRALRLEMKPFGIDIAIILPGDTKTAFTQRREASLGRDPLYEYRIENSLKKMAKDEQNGMPASSVVKSIIKQLKRRTMKASVVVGVKYKLILCVYKILPKKWQESIIYSMYSK